MALYKLTGVKIDREESGKRVSYRIGDTIEMTDKQAREYSWGIEPASSDAKPSEGQVGRSTVELKPDEEEKEGESEADLSILNSNQDEVIKYIQQNEDDDELIQDLRDAEMAGKRRKKVLDAMNEIIGS